MKLKRKKNEINRCEKLILMSKYFFAFIENESFFKAKLVVSSVADTVLTEAFFLFGQFCLLAFIESVITPLSLCSP